MIGPTEILFRFSLINNLSNDVFVNNDDGLETLLQNDHGYFKFICSYKEEICSR